MGVWRLCRPAGAKAEGAALHPPGASASRTGPNCATRITKEGGGGGGGAKRREEGGVGKESGWSGVFGGGVGGGWE